MKLQQSQSTKFPQSTAALIVRCCLKLSVVREHTVLPYEMHQLTANAFLSQMIEELSEEHKEILYFLSILQASKIHFRRFHRQCSR